MKKRLVISGGGTGGHVFPALAVVEELRARGYEDFYWIGSRKGMEANIVSRWNIPFFAIPSGKLRRYLSVRNVIDLFKVGAGILKSIFILRKLKPDAVFSKGGFVSVPPVIAARLLRIPVVSHESDFDPGLATRMNAASSYRVCIPYAESKAYFPQNVQERLRHTGNPVRKEVFAGKADEGRRLFGFPAERPLLVVLGGSLGARQLDQLVHDSLPWLREHWSVLHQRGTEPWDITDEPGVYISRRFLGPEYAHVLAAATVVLARAGAGSVWEIGVLAKPAIFLPLVEGSRGDQVRNAKHVASGGACIVLPKEGTAESFHTALDSLRTDSARRASMSEAWGAIVLKDGAHRVAEVVSEALERERP